MFVALRELRSAPWRTALITVTIAMLALVVTFLSVLTGGLAKASTSALDPFKDNGDSIIVQAMPSPSLNASQLTNQQISSIEQEAKAAGATAQPLYLTRTTVNETQAYVMSDPSVATGQAVIPKELQNKAIPATLTIHGEDFSTSSSKADPSLDHQPVILVNPTDAQKLTDSASAVVVNKNAFDPHVDQTSSVSGKDILELSASYRGEQTSLNSMTIMLYVISALVVGAFFTVWTIQRMGTLIVLGALGCTVKRLVAGATVQAFVVLVGGIVLGAAIAAATASIISKSAPVELSSATIAVPALILLVCGLAGAALSTIPITRIQPRQALQTI